MRGVATTIGRAVVFAAVVLVLARPFRTASAQQEVPENPPPPPAAEPPKEDEATSAPPAPPISPGPRVLTARETSEYLRKPGESDGTGYSEPIDWRAVPPWRQTSFFGLRAKGQVFVFVIDCSGSMSDDFRLIRAKQELRRCLSRMQYPQRYHVIFYNDRPRPMPAGVPVSANGNNRGKTLHWMDSVDAEGGTDPKGAMDQALGLRPDAVFLLSDGEYPEDTEGAISARNTKKVPIHCVDLSGGAAGDQLKQIAADSGGQYASRP